MNTATCTLLAVAQTYFDAAYEMDADKFASIFDRSSSVTGIGENGTVSVTPIEVWLASVRNMRAPKQSGLARRDLSDEILSIDISRDIALLKLRFEIRPDISPICCRV